MFIVILSLSTLPANVVILYFLRFFNVSKCISIEYIFGIILQFSPGSFRYIKYLINYKITKFLKPKGFPLILKVAWKN